MIIDKAIMMSKSQAVTAAASSTVIDQVKAGGPFQPGMFLVVQTKGVASNPTTSMTFAFQTSDDNFSSDTVTLYTETILKAALTKNTRLIQIPVPPGLKRYFKMLYTPVGGSATTGAFDAFLVKDYERQVAVS